MIITEINGNLFDCRQSYYLVHCISGDYALGAGIAKQFVEHFNMRKKLRNQYPIPNGAEYANVGKALLVDNVFNLVTKARYWHKPTTKSIYDTLCEMRDYCVEHYIDKIAMPRICCGLDKRDWPEIKQIITDVFTETGIEIAVYYQ